MTARTRVAPRSVPTVAAVVGPRHGSRPATSAAAMLALQRAIGNRAIARSVAETWRSVTPSPAALLLRQTSGSPVPLIAGRPEPDEGVSAELAEAPAAATSRDRVGLWLQAHKDEIVAAEDSFGIDRRAVAGAIAWEALHNVRTQLALTYGRFMGAGKLHIKDLLEVPAFLHTGRNLPEEVETAGLLPHRTLGERKAELSRPGGSVRYVAASMRLGSDIAKAHGYDIARDPAMLTFFYVSQTSSKWAALLAAHDPAKPLHSNEAMSKWTMENLDYLEAAVGGCELGFDPADIRDVRSPLPSPAGDYPPASGTTSAA